jgi:arylsulfatase A-like enzyme
MSKNRVQLAALIEHLDAGIARVLDTLDRLKLAENTIVMFTSDNGGVLREGANNGPWRSEKTHMYEGGLRVPCAVRWPGRIVAGSRTERIALSMDMFATVCDVVGAAPPDEIDGVSFLPTLSGQQQPATERDLYFVRREGGSSYGGLTIQALRRGPWKLIHDSPYGKLELYNLADDPYETTDLAARQPQRVRELQAALAVHIQRGGQVPWQKK